MIAKEMEEDFGENTRVAKDKQLPLTQVIFPIESRYRYQYIEVSLQGDLFLAKKSCHGCHGIGIYCWIPANKAQGTPRTPIRCTCLVPPEEEEI